MKDIATLFALKPETFVVRSDAHYRKHPVNNAAREALGGMVGPRLMTKAGLL
jgi:hypothetical protein